MKRLSFVLAFLLPLFLSLSLPRVTAATFGGAVNEVVVVRAYFSDRGMVEYVSSWKAPWEVNYKDGYMVLDVTAEEELLLTNLGYVLERDEQLSAQYSNPAKPLVGQAPNTIPGYPCYRTVEETLATATSLVAEYPTLASTVDIGNSWQKTQNNATGYDLVVLKLTNSAIPGPKPTVFIMSAVHAREYTTAELNTRFAEYLLDNYGTNADATWLLDHHEFHLLLQANPDGRKQAETGLSWRKNINNNYCANTGSRGADLNRNFSFEWGGPGASASQCDDTYRGASAASEPEVQAIEAYNLTIFDDVRPDDLGSPAPITTTGVFMDVHSYSQLVLWPWGFDEITGNDTAFQTFGRKMAYFNRYTPQQAVDLYPTSGTTDDFAYGDLGVPAFTFELGTAFFESCSNFENTVLPDNMEALLYMAKAARLPYQLPAGPDVLDLGLSATAVTSGTQVTLFATADDTRYQNSNGIEPTQNIAQVEAYLDIPYWEAGAVAIPLTAADGSFNSLRETVTTALDTTGLANGRHTLFVRGRDANGSWGVVSAVFLDILPPAQIAGLEGTITNAETSLPIDAAEVTTADGIQATTNGTGQYQTGTAPGAYQFTASAEGYAPQTVNLNLLAGQVLQQDFALTPTCAVWEDDVESGTNGWTTQSPWAITTAQSHSPTHSWTDSPGGNYGNNRNISLTSPIINLTGVGNVQLNFWHRCDTEAGWDFCRVEVSTNGTTWTQLAQYDGANTVWEEVTLAAPQLNNQANARVRFRFTTDTNTVADGWYVDDIQLIGTGVCTVVPTSPTAAFSSTTPDTLGETTQFTNTSTDANAYTWDFGDGSAVSHAVNASHTYTATGTFSVTLMASDGVLTDTVTHEVVIEPVVVITPTAAFTSTSPTTLGTATNFTNLSADADSYLWDFGDGATSTAVHPSHTYTATGTFSVTLLAGNGVLTDTVTHPLEVVPVGVLTPTAAFTLTTPLWLGETAVFTNTSTNAVTYTWDFGDGSPLSTVPSPTHTYTTTGVFTVTLTAHNGSVSHTTSHPLTVRPMPTVGYVIHLPLVQK
ncbi:MAG: M14 family zinc carboxypeptidase [Chloroflexi bacterium]|nr:M14 family zinc carboxypeptidase [Chloroflexota bacterium]